MSKTGRPSKLNEIVIQMFEKAFSVGLSPKLACQHVGISKSTYNTWMRRGEQEREKDEDTLFADLHRRIKRAESNHALANLALIQKAAKEDGIWTASAWLLERRHPEYRRQPEQVVEVKIDNRSLSVTGLIEQIRESDQLLQEIMQRPVIDLDEE
mgnify:CR=1 FL=1|tara:strand:- start:910 stop:1374 length:465 start_codon:yes stop_codon:yes gene_type:complete